MVSWRKSSLPLALPSKEHHGKSHEGNLSWGELCSATVRRVCHMIVNRVEALRLWAGVSLCWTVLTWGW